MIRTTMFFVLLAFLNPHLEAATIFSPQPKNLFIVDNFIFYEPNHLLIGFSGIIFGSFSFIFLSSIYGKEYIFNIFIGLKKNYEIKKLMTIFLSLGMVYSFMPGISLTGHLVGILSGFFIFFL